jgi:hypothetical protein
MLRRATLSHPRFVRGLRDQRKLFACLRKRGVGLLARVDIRMTGHDPATRMALLSASIQCGQFGLMLRVEVPIETPRGAGICPTPPPCLRIRDHCAADGAHEAERKHNFLGHVEIISLTEISQPHPKLAWISSRFQGFCDAPPTAPDGLRGTVCAAPAPHRRVRMRGVVAGTDTSDCRGPGMPFAAFAGVRVKF